MDKLDVPKKVNRHVLKAIYFLSARGEKNPSHEAITNVVRATMRDSTPQDLEAVVLESLKIMIKLGLVRKSGSSFSINDKNERRRKEDRNSKLDPNMKKRHISESSSEENVDKSRRRSSANRSLAREGQGVELPKVRRSHHNLDEPVDENAIGDKLKESRRKIIKTSHSSRKRRHLNSSSSRSSSKRKRMRSRSRAMHKRTRMRVEPKATYYSFSEMDPERAFVEQTIVTVTNTGVQTTQYNDTDDTEMDDTPSLISKYIDQNIEEGNSIHKSEVPLENCEHSLNEDGHPVTQKNSENPTVDEKQSDVKCQDSARQIYASTNFKDSNIEIDSKQNEDQSVQPPAQVTKPNSKGIVQDVPQEKQE